MRPKLMIVAAIALASSSAVGAQVQTQTPVLEAASVPAGIDRSTQTDDVHFRSDSTQRMTVPVLLSGQGPYRFLVDTGADRTAISREVARSLQFVSSEPALLHSISGASTITTARVPLLQLTRNEVRGINAPLLEAEAFTAGQYRLVFSAGTYFAAQGVNVPQPAFIDEVTLDFGVADPALHYHVPLLVSPFSFSTYRGS